MPGSMEISDLTVSYGDHAVVRGVDLSLGRGTVTAIIGPSGCGKTTLLRCLNRLTHKSATVRGRISLDGEETSKLDPVLLRRRVGMVFQKPNPFPMSIRENVLYGVKAQGDRKQDRRALVESALRKAALWDEVKDRLNTSALSLSLGQQQRLCIARALAVSPEVVLMDEPAASLDPVSTGALEASIIAMKGDYTVVVVTHDFHEAERVSDFTVFMLEGRIVEAGETRQLFAYAQQEETREYLQGRLLAATV